MTKLFSQMNLRSARLDNRIVVSPMLQNAAVDGSATSWHLMHYGNLSISGAGLMILEATAVEAAGRIGPRCLGLYSDDNETALAHILKFIRANSEIKVGVQLAHAGRKGSIAPGANPRRAMTEEEGGWPVISSSVYQDSVHATPRPMTRADMDRQFELWGTATKRAQRLGFDLIELHYAHGYLVNQFLSPIINTRTDTYGGSRENRMRFALELYDECRRLWPTEKPMGVRISATDWIEGGWTIEDSVAFAAELQARGCDYVCASSGGVAMQQKIEGGPGYQTPFAKAIRTGVGINSIAVGSITEPRQAEQILVDGAADLVALGRPMLYNPRWAWHAAVDLGVHMPYHYRYRLCHPAMGEMLKFPETNEKIGRAHV